MVKQLQTWYVITNKENIDMDDLFHKPWSDTPNYHITTFDRQLERWQAKCEDNFVIIINADKVNQIVAVLHETPVAPSSDPLTSDRASYNAAIEWVQALEEQGTKYATETLSPKSVGCATTVVIKYASSAVTVPPSGSADLATLQAMVYQLAATVATLSKTIWCGDVGGGGCDRQKPKSGGGGGGAGGDADTNRVHLWY